MPLPAFGRSRSKSKAAHTAGHQDGAPGRQADAADDDHELSSYLAALAPEADPESTGSGHRFGDAEVYQLRLSQLAGQQLKDVAAERGTSPRALAREWVLERLAWEAQAADRHRGPVARDPEDPPTDEIRLDDLRQWSEHVRGGIR
ncbi:hypothetical protein [Saccharomonospora saliphila]|uniref:hypothetical protein n=1 Tax=Saccharomonospora saliphila TaxID=369829 RepID=UPI000370302A|nr:hypothetical protein [Saccharomonospora saliphila]